jgi:hypothetical protein
MGPPLDAMILQEPKEFGDDERESVQGDPQPTTTNFLFPLFLYDCNDDDEFSDKTIQIVIVIKHF